MVHCRTEDMVADVMTKALDTKLHEKHAVKISRFAIFRWRFQVDLALTWRKLTPLSR